MSAPTARSLLPYLAPISADRRLLLYGIRRMAAGGIRDAHAATAFLAAFGLHYRRPLVLLRTLLIEMSRAAETTLLIAACCCPRMSTSERAILDALGAVERSPDQAHQIMARLLNVPRCSAVLGSTQTLAAAFSDLARPLHTEEDCI